MTVMIIGFPFVKIQIPDIGCIEIARRMMRGIRWLPAPTGTDFPHTPGLDQRPDFWIPFSLAVAGLPADPGDLLRAGCWDCERLCHVKITFFRIPGRPLCNV